MHRNKMKIIELFSIYILGTIKLNYLNIFIGIMNAQSLSSRQFCRICELIVLKTTHIDEAQSV